MKIKEKLLNALGKFVGYFSLFIGLTIVIIIAMSTLGLLLFGFKYLFGL